MFETHNLHVVGSVTYLACVIELRTS